MPGEWKRNDFWFTIGQGMLVIKIFKIVSKEQIQFWHQWHCYAFKQLQELVMSSLYEGPFLLHVWQCHISWLAKFVICSNQLTCTCKTNSWSKTNPLTWSGLWSISSVKFSTCIWKPCLLSTFYSLTCTMKKKVFSVKTVTNNSLCHIYWCIFYNVYSNFDNVIANTMIYTQATDADSGVWGEITYDLRGAGSDLWVNKLVN